MSTVAFKEDIRAIAAGVHYIAWNMSSIFNDLCIAFAASVHLWLVPGMEVGQTSAQVWTNLAVKGRTVEECRQLEAIAYEASAEAELAIPSATPWRTYMKSTFSAESLDLGTWLWDHVGACLGFSATPKLEGFAPRPFPEPMCLHLDTGNIF